MQRLFVGRAEGIGVFFQLGLLRYNNKDYSGAISALQRAVDIVMDGTYVLSNWYDPQGRLRTFDCRATRVSPFRMMVEMPVVGKVGDRLTSYFRDFGQFQGSISDTMERSFLLELEMSRARREKLSDMLVWLEKKQKDPLVRDMRGQARIVPESPHSTLTFADGVTDAGFGLVTHFKVPGDFAVMLYQPRYTKKK